MPKLPLLCLLGFALWPIVLVSGIGVFRVSQVLTGKAKPNSFPSGTPHGSDIYWRLNRAHMNSLESLPIFGAVVLAGVVAHADTPLFGNLALTALLCRVAQSTAHISGSSNMHVNVRFTFFLVQNVCFAVMALIAGSTLLAG
jgi:uncharacterized MAPEG superfamily protein